MKFVCSVFLLLVMSVNVALPAIERLYSGKTWQAECSSTDDTEEEKKNEREEKEKEKEVYLWKHCATVEHQAFWKQCERPMFPEFVGLRSEAYTFLPEIPPDAALAARFAA